MTSWAQQARPRAFAFELKVNAGQAPTFNDIWVEPTVGAIVERIRRLYHDWTGKKRFVENITVESPDSLKGDLLTLPTHTVLQIDPSKPIFEPIKLVLSCTIVTSVQLLDRAKVKKLYDREDYWSNPFMSEFYKQVLLPWTAESWCRPTRGVLLYGPPGTGKSTLANAVLKLAEDDAILVTSNPDEPFSATRFFGGLVGETEKAIKREASVCLQNRQRLCVMFVDEFESLGADRADAKEGSHKRDFLNTFLSIVGSPDYSNLLVIAATNFKHKLDPAVIREGRLEHHIFVGPLSAAERLARIRKAPRTASEAQKQSWAELVAPLDDQHRGTPFYLGFVQRTMNFTSAQLESLQNQLFNELIVRPYIDVAAPETVKLMLEPKDFTLELDRFLYRNQSPNLLFNQVSSLRDRFDELSDYDTLVRGWLWMQREYPSASGGLAGRYMLELGLPQVKFMIELSAGYEKLSTRALGAKEFTFLKQSHYDSDLIFKVLFPITIGSLLKSDCHEYVQIIDRRTVKVQNEDEFYPFLMGKLEECRHLSASTGGLKPRTMLVFRVDDIAGRLSRISVSSTTGSSVDQRQSVAASQSQSVSQSNSWSDQFGNSSTRTAIQSTSHAHSIARAKQTQFTSSDTVGSSHSHSHQSSTTENKQQVSVPCGFLGLGRRKEWRSTFQYSTTDSVQDSYSSSHQDTVTNSSSITLNDTDTRTLTDQQSVSENYSRTQSRNVNNQSTQSGTVTKDESSSINASTNRTSDSQLLYPKNYESLIRFARNYVNFDAAERGPDLVFVVEDPFLAEKLRTDLSWGELREPPRCSPMKTGKGQECAVSLKILEDAGIRAWIAEQLKNGATTATHLGWLVQQLLAIKEGKAGARITTLSLVPPQHGSPSTSFLQAIIAADLNDLVTLDLRGFKWDKFWRSGSLWVQSTGAMKASECIIGLDTTDLAKALKERKSPEDRYLQILVDTDHQDSSVTFKNWTAASFLKKHQDLHLDLIINQQGRLEALKFTLKAK